MSERPNLARRLATIVGEPNVLTGDERRAPYLKEWRGLYRGKAEIVVRPGSTEEMAAVVAACAESGVPMVPQGGNTGLVGGGVGEAGSVILSTERLTRIREIDPLNDTITVDAGMVLSDVQTAAAGIDRLFPLSIGAEGSCRIGGNLSTNAGGVQVLKYGNARDLVLGLEVVLPDGRIWSNLSGLRKDNTGYALKHLFIGAEGTLGVITAATLKLFPAPRQTVTGFAAIPDPEAAVALLTHLKAGSGDTVTSFELIARRPVDFALTHVPGSIDPLESPADWYVLLECTTPAAGETLRDQVEESLGTAFETGLITDATLAANEEQRRRLWHLREAVVEAQRWAGASIKHDVSVPVSRLPAFIADGAAAVERTAAGARLCCFGHVGDGNLHFNVTRPEAMEDAAFLALYPEMHRAVHDQVVAHGGSISAEHGVGRLKREELAERKAPIDLDLMRGIKHSLDPKGLMNPGVIL